MPTPVSQAHAAVCPPTGPRRWLRRLRQAYDDRQTASVRNGIRHTSSSAAALLRHRLEAPAPAMVCRFGAVEITCLRNHRTYREGSRWRRWRERALGHLNRLDWNPDLFRPMATNAGFFPLSYAAIDQFYERMLQDMLEIDILGSWCAPEAEFLKACPQAERVWLRDLEPWSCPEAPWSEALAGQRVLVLHPFAESIRRQYDRRRFLFRDPRLLPDFELLTLPAVQSIGGEGQGFSSWFEALAHMERQIAGLAFDIAILGCGAYGLPLAAHVKRLGRKAVHLGGATQLLFGIFGRRWENDAMVASLLNEHWCRPAPAERPAHYRDVENGCYW